MKLRRVLLLSCWLCLSPVYGQNMEIKDHTGKATFMDELETAPSARTTLNQRQEKSPIQSPNMGQQILFKAFESVQRKRLDEADRWIIYASLQGAVDEMLKARDDEKFLVQTLSNISASKKLGKVQEPSCDVLVLSALIQARLHGKDALSLLTRVLNEYPNYGAINQVKSRIAGIEEQEEIAKSTGIVKLANQKDLLKWKPEQFPLKVFIPNDAEAASVEGYQKGDCNQLRSAFEAWQHQVGGIVKFLYLSDPRKADIKCGWESDPEKLGPSGCIGCCARTWNKDSRLLSVSIKILTVRKEQQNAGFYTNWRSRHLKEVCMHEVGHSLGLDHSPRSHDVMFFASKIQPLDCLSDGDIESFEQTYHPAEVAAKYAQEASELEQRHLDRPAIVQYSFALHFDPDNPSLRERQTVCLLRVACEEMKKSVYAEAIGLLVEAKDLLTEKSSSELRLKVLESLLTAYRKTGKSKEADDIQRLLDSAQTEMQSR